MSNLEELQIELDHAKEEIKLLKSTVKAFLTWIADSRAEESDRERVLRLVNLFDDDN